MEGFSESLGGVKKTTEMRAERQSRSLMLMLLLSTWSSFIICSLLTCA